MKVTEGVWVVKIAKDYDWAVVYGKYKDANDALRSGYEERDYDGFKVRYLHEGEELPDVETIF